LEMIAKGAYQEIIKSLVNTLRGDGLDGDKLIKEVMKAVDEIIEIMSFGQGFARSLLEFSHIPISYDNKMNKKLDNDNKTDEIALIAERLGVNLGEILEDEQPDEEREDESS